MPATPSETMGDDLGSALGAKHERVLTPQPAQYTLSFENLSVHVPGSKTASWLSPLVRPLRFVATEYLGMSVLDRDPLAALTNVTGLLASGELCLVLGSNDESKSTLLRALSGRLSAQDKQTGTLALNGIAMSESYRGWRRMCPYVSPSDQDHAPVLTVRETFDFARRCTSNSKDLIDVQDRDVQKLMKTLGLDHVADTVVGDENLRGISGGQKRRVTVGEMLDPSCRFICMENITDGLSSTDSVKLIKDLANTCHEGRYSAFISLLQPSDDMITLFDKLLVLTNEGEMSYFGPVDRSLLREIFLGTTDPEGDKGSIADLVLEASLDKTGRMEEEIKRRYDYSKTSQFVTNAISQLKLQPNKGMTIFDLFVQDDYPNSFMYRFKLITRRRVKLIQRNSVTWTRMVIALLFGLIIGSLFANSPNTLGGSLSKNGYIFLHCFIVLMLSAAVTLPSGFRERATLFKHRSAEFYCAKSSYIALLVTDAPLSILEAIFLSVVSYFWVGMRNGASEFFYFLGMLIALECAGQSLGRLLCAVCRKQVTANSLSSVIILVFGTVGGFMPPYKMITPVLRWLSWVTPVSYAFEGLMLNEFFDLKFEPLMGASGNIVIPIELGGHQWLKAYNLPRSNFASITSIKVFDIGMVFLFAVLYDILGFHFIEKTRSWYHHQIRRPQSNVKLSFGMGRGSTETKAEVANNDSSWPSSLIARNISYEVPSKESNTIKLLDNVNVHFRCGRMTCLMGTSGAGKSTFLDVIAGYKTGGTVTGEVLIDGRAKDPATWKKISGYSEQQDILNPYLSVLETLRFTANCRLPKSANKEEVVQRVMKLMDINEWADSIIGREKDGEGLPKHVRKRVTIANELVALPKILFLDEPTTGLDTNPAALVINAVRQATDAMGLITVATIHQPSKRIFSAFDDVLFLTKGGKMTYMGESARVLDHFGSLASTGAPEDCNPADYCLGVIDQLTPDDARAGFERSDLYRGLVESIDKETEKGRASAAPSISSKRANNAFSEVWLLTKRHAIVQWRNPSYCFMRMASSIVMSLFLSILFFSDKSTLEGAVFSIGAIFFLVFVLVIPMQAAVVPLVEDRAVLYRETVSGCYSKISYGVGQLLADQPFHAINTVLMFVCFYFIVGFKLESNEMGYFVLMLYLSNWVIQSLGQLYALATPNEESANGLGGLSVMLSVILMGFLINYQMMPHAWKWAYWANLFHYILQGLVTNEMAGSDYYLDIGRTVPGINVSRIFAFNGGSQIQVDQLSSLLELVSKVPNGTNPEPDDGKLSLLIDCTLTNECFTNTTGFIDISSGFIGCYMFEGLFSKPPCTEEFNALAETVDATITNCFSDMDMGNEALGSRSILTMPQVESSSIMTLEEELSSILSVKRELFWFPGKNSSNPLPDDTNKDSTVLCLARAILPVDSMKKVTKIIRDLFGIVAFVFAVINDGINIPGEGILFFFGWATFNNEGTSLSDSFVAPFKWYYCMVSVAVFLVAIEIFKLAAVRFCVWTKR